MEQEDLGRVGGVGRPPSLGKGCQCLSPSPTGASEVHNFAVRGGVVEGTRRGEEVIGLSGNGTPGVLGDRQ